MVKIRLQRFGRHKRPFYRIVAADERCRRDGRFLELIGHYDPLTDPISIKISKDLFLKWINFGAQPSDTVRKLVNKVYPNLLDEIESRRRQKIILARRKRKERQKARAV